MWPWEHVAGGQLLLSLGFRALGREPPAAGTTASVLFGTPLPDLVDEPLSWEFGGFPSGHAAGHSAFVAVPLGLVVAGVARRWGRPRLGVALVAGAWSHLALDVLAPLRDGGGPLPGRVLWPVVVASAYDRDYGLRRGLVYSAGSSPACPRWRSRRYSSATSRCRSRRSSSGWSTVRPASPCSCVR